MSLTKQQVTALYVAVYNRAPDAAGLTYWTTTFNGTYAEAAAGFVGHLQFQNEYGGLSNEEIVEKFYTNILGSAGDAEGIAFWTAQLDDGATEAEVLASFLDATLSYDGDDAAALTRQATLENRVEVGLYFAETLGENSNVTDVEDLENDPAYQQSIEAIAGVTADEETVATAKALVDQWAADVVDPVDPEVEGQTIFLTEGADRDVNAADGFIKGDNDANTTFIGDIVQNQFGQQVNTLGTGDRLDGGNGANTLDAQVTQGAYAGGGSDMAIQAQTKNVQTINLEAVQSAADQDSTVFVNAKDMENVNYIGSDRSNASLTIQDLTSKGTGGTADMTIGMKYTGNADSQWKESDLKVLFDQDYLTRKSELKNGWNYEILNQASWDKNSSEPVKGFPLQRITFTLEGADEPVVLNFTAEEREQLVTQQDLVDMLNAKLAEQGLEDGLTFALGNQFTDGDGRVSTSIDLINTKEDQKVVKGTVGLDEDSPAGNLFWNNKQLADVSTDTPVTVNVELEKVGRAGDGGELVIGSMNKGGDYNTWDGVNTVAEGTVSGVERFNVTVDGSKAESSSLSGMRSTNNNLREVNIVSAEGSDADLTIGNANSNTSAGLKDVQTLNASGFNGDLNVTAVLTDEVADKYLQNGSQSGNFVYDGGTGNDTFDVTLFDFNSQNDGSDSHGDFNFALNSGEGDDTITVTTIGWVNSYQNQATNANLSINAGAGDDTVNLQGSGDWDVDLGAGNDVIYVDNGGLLKASWIFNVDSATTAADHALGEWAGVAGGGNNSFNLYQAGVALTLTDNKGGEFELYFALNTDANFQVSQKSINEQIKWAIENNSLFSKLVEAQTGQMADTLIIDSLIDGDAVDLSVDFYQLDGGATAEEIAEFNTTFGANVTATGLANAYNVNNDYTPSDVAVNNVFTTDAAYVAGSDGMTTGFQQITGGTGNDIFVLGTSANQVQGLVYDDSVNNGFDTVLNFNSGDDYLSFLTDAKFVDFGQYQLDTNDQLTNEWSTSDGFNGSNDFGITVDSTTYNANNLAKDDVFFRVSEDWADEGQYTIEAFKVTKSGDVSVAEADNITSIGVVGTIDFGQNTTLDIANFLIA